jgi:hypothetical protein
MEINTLDEVRNVPAARMDVSIRRMAQNQQKAK